MKSTLDYRDGHLCILNESEPGAAAPAERQEKFANGTPCGKPLRLKWQP